MKKIDIFEINKAIEKNFNEILQGRESIELINCQQFGWDAQRVSGLIGELRDDPSLEIPERYRLSQVQSIIILEKEEVE